MNDREGGADNDTNPTGIHFPKASAMSDTCKILAHITVDSLDHLGQNPAAGMYICATSTVYFPPTGPYVCAGAAAATSIGKLMSNHAFKEMSNWALEKGCDVVVFVGQEVSELAVVQGRQGLHQIKEKLETSKRELKAVNTAEGIQWLMRYLSR